jgi:hypothetical protein
MIHNLTRRIDKIEKDIGKDKDKPVWLRLPRKMLGLDGNPEELVEIEGCRTMTDLMVRADKARKERRYDEEHRKPA